MSTHTPGPWSVNDASNVRAGEATIALTYRNNIGMAVREELANARLMAAAPELLAALERVMQRAPDCVCTECEQAHAAIRKAKGEA